MVCLTPITRANVLAVCALDVAPSQRGFVSPNAVSLAEAYVRPEAKPFAVDCEGVAVGFVMLYDDVELPIVGLWRLMIDHAHQGQGYGSDAVALIIDHVRGLGRVGELHVGAMPGQGGPGPFYERLGFVTTGEVRDDGEVRYRLPIGAEP